MGLLILMRKILVAFLLLVATAPCSLFAQNTLTIIQKDGQQFHYGFSEKPVITYTDNDLVISTDKVVVNYPLTAIRKFVFTDGAETQVEGIEADNKPLLSLEDYMVEITGGVADANVIVFASDGKNVFNGKFDSEGRISFSIAEFPDGVYVIKTENLTCKILKK